MSADCGLDNKEGVSECAGVVGEDVAVEEHIHHVPNTSSTFTSPFASMCELRRQAEAAACAGEPFLKFVVALARIGGWTPKSTAVADGDDHGDGGEGDYFAALDDAGVTGAHLAAYYELEKCYERVQRLAKQCWMDSGT